MNYRERNREKNNALTRQWYEKNSDTARKNQREREHYVSGVTRVWSMLKSIDPETFTDEFIKEFIKNKRGGKNESVARKKTM